jgi:hypothetical protein
MIVIISKSNPREVVVMPWSIPAAQAAGFAAGVAAGELAGDIAKEFGANERAERIIRQTAHTVASTGVRWLIHAGMADLAGALTAPVLAASGALAHETAHTRRAIDRAPVPSLST